VGEADHAEAPKVPGDLCPGAARAERQAEIDKISGDKREVAFGSQIRTYTLAPYQLVKDERTRHETGNVGSVLDGEVQEFVEAWLQWRRRESGN
jgi:peptide chain release factor 2